MNKRLIEMTPQNLEQIPFSQMDATWAARFLNAALLELLSCSKEKF